MGNWVMSIWELYPIFTTCIGKSKSIPKEPFIFKIVVSRFDEMEV